MAGRCVCAKQGNCGAQRAARVSLFYNNARRGRGRRSNARVMLRPRAASACARLRDPKPEVLIVFDKGDLGGYDRGRAFNKIRIHIYKKSPFLDTVSKYHLCLKTIT
ncbi:hypothetical protein EVAR_15751_1 [Eumeta japonica]|uniref:Uncharacterized protein n=1 Tax=Eumeta variegata TaxID=151549 RepID=A0A4C1ZA70_EUMVA|nr:hypothetical protein EVAR_15751_1 [Eumeta japonica]